MEQAQKLQLMMERFVHPNSTFAEQVILNKNDRDRSFYFPVRKGDCNHTPKHKQKDCPNIKELVFTEKNLTNHLIGKSTYAPYQLDDDGMVKWLCIDVDSDNDQLDRAVIQQVTISIAQRINSELKRGHILVEDSGGRGYHLWVFFDAPVHAAKAHTLGHRFTNGIEDSEDFHVEVYPKQVASKAFGNTVKLPLGIHRRTGRRCMFVNATFEELENPWEALERVVPVSAAWIDDNVTIVPPRTDTRHEPDAYAPRCMVNVMAEGSEQGKRDEVSFKLACYLRSQGLTERLVVTTMSDWNALNKPPMDEDELHVKIESAFNNNYAWWPCSLRSFDTYCQSSCRHFERKVQQRWFAKESPIGKISRD